MSDEFDILPALVLDNGSGSCKAGFAGDDEPKAVVPAIVGRPRTWSTSEKIKERETYVGQDAKDNWSELVLKYPIEHGIIKDWDDMEAVWHEVIHGKLQINPEQHPVLLTEAPMNPKANRERMAQLMFESFNVPALYVETQAVLSLYSLGRTSGIVLDIGDGVSHTVPVHEGHVIEHAIKRLNLGGRTLTDWMARLLMERGMSFTSSTQMEMVKEIKEKYAYVSSDYDGDIALGREHDKFMASYELPDGSEITVGNERFRCAEALFQPSLIGMESPGIAEVVHQCISKCPIDVKRQMYGDIILSGGTTLLPNIDKRLETELRPLLPASMKVRVIAPERRQYSVWKGGSILAALNTFMHMVWTQEEYYDIGPNIVHQSSNF